MSYTVSPGNIFGRIGTGIGKGLAESVPKEIERYRLAEGLKELGQQQGQTPFQQFSQLAAIPGVTPQMLQSGSELLRQQNLRNAYGSNRNFSPETQTAPPGQDFKRINFANLDQRAISPQEKIQGKTSNVSPKEIGQPQIVNVSPLQESKLERIPWTPQQRDASISRYIDKGFLPDKAEQLSADDEKRFLSEPKAYQERFNQLKEAEENAKSALHSKLRTKLETGEKLIGEKLPGTLLNDLERGMARDLRLNPNLTTEDVANDWSERALNLDKSRNLLNTLSKTTGLENILRNTVEQKLDAIQKSFADVGRQEEYYDLLRAQFGLSPGAAASKAFPQSKSIKDIISKVPYESSLLDFRNEKNFENKSRKIALDIAKNLSDTDSILSIARSLKMKSPAFDEWAFFNELNNNVENLRLNPRQRLELQEGQSGFLPYWGDLLYLPRNKG